MDAKQPYIVTNPTNENLIIYEVGLFAPGDNTIMLDKSQVALLEDNNVLTFAPAQTEAAEKPKSKTTAIEAPKEAVEEN